MSRTLCIGVDITWWGGSSSNRISQRETIVAISIGPGRPSAGDISIETLALSDFPNPNRADPTEANYDRNGEHLISGILATVARMATASDRVVIALDAPLEARHRTDQPPRRKAVPRGEKMGSARRECEDRLSEFAATLSPDVARGWNRDLKIQSGSPIAPRVSSVLKQLEAKGYETIREPQQRPQLSIIEIFPSAAIWALGTQGHYGSLTSKEVRAYKSKQDRLISAADALEIALRPLAGFAPLLTGCEHYGVTPASMTRWINAIAENAVTCAAGRGPGTVNKGKGFDDPIDSGLAALTCVVFAAGRSHLFGNGTDGAIIGPGALL